MALTLTLPPVFVGPDRLVYEVTAPAAADTMEDVITNAQLIDATNGIGAFPRSRLYQLLAAGYADQAAARVALLETGARILVYPKVTTAAVDESNGTFAVDVALTGGAGTAAKIQMQGPSTGGHADVCQLVIEAWDPATT